MTPSYHTIGEATVRCSSEANRFGLDASYGMYVIVTATLYQNKGESAYSNLLGTRVVDSIMHVIRTIQMLLNTCCFFITGLKFFVIDFSSMSIYESSWNSHRNRITHAAQNMKSTRSWKRMDWSHVITHLMNLSMWQSGTTTQLSMYAAITPLIHHSTRAKVESHNRTSYQHTIKKWVVLTCLTSYQHHIGHQLEVKVVLAIIY